MDFKSKPEETYLYVGTVDEEHIIGEKIPGSEKQTEHGVAFERHGGIGKDGFVFGEHVYFENAIPNLSDKMPGLKYLRGPDEGKGFL